MPPPLGEELHKKNVFSCISRLGFGPKGQNPTSSSMKKRFFYGGSTGTSLGQFCTVCRTGAVVALGQLSTGAVVALGQLSSGAVVALGQLSTGAVVTGAVVARGSCHWGRCRCILTQLARVFHAYPNWHESLILT